MGESEGSRGTPRSEVLHQRRTEEGCHVAVVRYRRGLRLEPHAHEFSSISMLLRGRLREDVGSSTVTPGVFDLVIKPRGTRHENVFFGRGVTMIQIAPARETLRRATHARCPLTDWVWTDGMDAARAMVRLARDMAHRGDDVELQPAVDDVLAALSVDEDDRATGPAPPWLRRVRDALDEAADRAVEAPSVAVLAADAGVHRVHLSREFRRHFGVPPTEYRVRARLREAANRVAGSHASLSGAAYRTGFADQAHMTREFSSRLGVTPLEYRRLLPPSAA